MEEFGNWVWDWFGVVENRDRTTAIATATGTIIAILLFLGALIAGSIRLFRHSAEQAPQQTPPIPPGAAGVMTITLEEYEARQQRRGEEIAARLVGASEEDRARLASEKTELARRLAGIETSYAKAQETIAELREAAERYGNALGAEKLEEARRIFEEGDFDAADSLFAHVEDAGDLEVERTAAAAFQRGKIAEEQVRWADAAEHYAKAARLAPDYGRLNKAQQFYLRAGQLHEAARWAEELVDLAKTEIGEDQPHTATALNNLGTIYNVSGRYDEAEPLYRQVLEIDAKTIGTAHPDYAIHLNNLALLLKAMGRHDEAEPLYRQALEIDANTIGTAHPDYATHLNNLASLLRDMGCRDEAEPLYRQALEIVANTIGTAHPDYATHLNNLAGLLKDLGRIETARPLLDEAVAIWRISLGEDHPTYATGLWWKADFANAGGDWDAARGDYSAAYAVYIRVMGEDHPDTKKLADQYAGLLRAHFPDDPALAELEAAFGPDIGR